MTDQPLIVRVGEALYGPRWQGPMAEALDVRLDTVKAWRRGRSTVPLTVWNELYHIATMRRGDLYDLLPKMTLAAQLTASQEARL